MTILVTGGAGFIGSHVVDLLSASGYTPRVFDLAPPPLDSKRVDWIVGDLLDRVALARAMHGCHTVIHLAAVADVGVVIADPARADAVNVRGTHNALEAARLAGVEHFVFASTVWVYGGANGKRRTLDEDTPIVLPSHFYTATKLAGEMYCRSYAALYGLRQTILRFGIPVLTYRDYFNEYRAHPEHKALSPDGQPCHPWTRGILQPPIIEAAPNLARIGKESLPSADDDPNPSEPFSPGIVYTERVCLGCGGPLTDRQEHCSDRCRKRTRRTSARVGASAQPARARPR